MDENAVNCEEIINNPNTASFIVRSLESVELMSKIYGADCYSEVNSSQSVIYRKNGNYEENTRGLITIPRLFSLLDLETVEYTGVGAIRRQPRLDYYGRDVLLGFVDTGIDYTHPAFKQVDNTSRILGIWDQTISPGDVEGGRHPMAAKYGTAFTKEDIDRALKSENPLEVVPSEDEIGHGTAMAGIAGGNVEEEVGFSGLAPLAGILMVKLRPAREKLRTFFQINDDVPAYQEDDIMLGIRYLLEMAEIYRRPLVICIALGSNFGDHVGGGQLGVCLEELANSRGLCVVTAAGNENGRSHHYLSPVLQPRERTQVEINVNEGQQGMSVSMWSSPPEVFSVSVISPSGESTAVYSMRQKGTFRHTFVFERTQLAISPQLFESVSGEGTVLFRFSGLSEGVWRIQVENTGNSAGPFNMWLPVYPFLDDDTIFLTSNPNTTICDPANNPHLLTSATCNQAEDSLYLYSSRGNARNGSLKPDITSPGVNVLCPNVGGGYSRMNGSSIASAVAGGISALLLEWGVLQGNYPIMNTAIIKGYLIRGAKRSNIVYPNPEWGYGVINLYGVFENLQGR